MRVEGPGGWKTPVVEEVVEARVRETLTSLESMIVRSRVERWVVSGPFPWGGRVVLEVGNGVNGIRGVVPGVFPFFCRYPGLLDTGNGDRSPSLRRRMEHTLVSKDCRETPQGFDFLFFRYESRVSRSDRGDVGGPKEPRIWWVGLRGVSIPLHPGRIRFDRDRQPE